MAEKKIQHRLLFLGLLICLLQVWWPHYYITGDGPCHLYNAKVLHDIWSGNDVTFYSRFYQVIYQTNPNWLSHILLGLPMYLFSGVLAEKIFLSLYLCLLSGGFYLLLKKISDTSSYWVLIIFLFVFHHTLAKGFYNFSLSTAFYFWVVWSWIRFIDRKNTLNALLFFCFSGAIFFTQLLPFVFAMFTCLALILTYAVSKEYSGPQKQLSFFVKNVITMALLTAPFVALMFWFTDKEGGLNLQLRPHLYRLIELVQFKYAVSASHNEDFLAAVAGITLTTLMIACIAIRIKDGIRIRKYDGFLLSLLFVMFVCIFFPEDFLGRVILISMRAQLFVYILVACCVAYMLPRKLKNAGGFIVFICFLGMSLVRISFMSKASEGVEELTSAARFISPYSIVLPLDFAPAGKDAAGKVVGNFNYLFSHAAHYIGAEKPLILLDNYEANSGYFPLLWVYNKNPYAHLSTYEGIEAQPPSANIDRYCGISGEKINYVLLWCYDSSFLSKGHYRQLAAQIDSSYHLIYTSPTNRTMLYARNP